MRTLSDLKSMVEQLIAYQGPNAPVAAWVFTGEDVVDGVNEEVVITDAQTEQILDLLGGNDFIFETIFNCLDDCRFEVMEMSQG